MLNIVTKPFLHKNHTSLLLTTLLILTVTACSTKKNTWTSRAYQELNTRYNVYFNGKTSYDDGLKNILRANIEDYSTIIPMYPISHHKNATVATSDMDRTIEKCRKAIKLHSIKIKPAKNYKKASQPDYKLFYNQEEFNPALKEAWLLLGQAEFHKGDFLGSVGTFSYIARHYSTDKDMLARCQLWTARAYGEMDWIYEAEQVLSKLEQENLKRSSLGLFASVNADLLLKKHQYKEAIPFLELAISKETDKAMKQRFSYLLAQLYQHTQNNKAAYNAYSDLIKINPPFEMDFYARINRTQLGMVNIVKVRSELNKMLKNSNNKEYHDQIYFALGNTYLTKNDTIKAIENYKISIKESTRNGIDKALTLITLGDLYYIKQNYMQAQPCYDEASKIISNENDDYARVTKRAEVLGELVIQQEIVNLQDSLQTLSTLPETKRLEAVNRVIDNLVEAEKQAEKDALKQREGKSGAIDDELTNMAPIGMNPDQMGGWYFYNPDLIRSGQAEFQKKWGRRKLEDNWRRTNKSSSLFSDEINSAPVQTAVDTLGLGTEKLPEIADNKNPEFYLRQIPITAAQIKKSNNDIATALFEMGLIYKDKVEDMPMAIKTFEEFINRFSSDERSADAHFYIYLVHSRLNNLNDAELYRTKITTSFPDTKYQKILSQPDYTERLEKMYREQDSIYNLTYQAYTKSDYATVFNYVAYTQKNYPLSTLMPKFLFLNALSIGKKETPDKFKTALTELVATYPESDVSAMSKDILALMQQGLQAKTGKTSGTLLARREQNTKTEIEEINPQRFSADRKNKHRIMLINSATATEINKLLYNIASYNFSSFLIKDFDLAINKLDSVQNSLSVTNFESYDEAQWYLNSINKNPELTELISELISKKIIISEDNFALLRTGQKLEDYQQFMAQNTTARTDINNTKATKKSEVALKTETPKPLAAIKSAVNEPKIEKPAEQTEVNPKPVVAEKAIAKTEVKQEKTQVETPTKPISTEVVKPTATVPAPVIKAPQPKEEEVPIFKNLFAYRANEAHFVAIYIVSGTIDFEKTKVAIDAYNSQNYSIMNLKVNLETVNNQQIIIIGSLADAQIGKSYLLRIVKEKTIFDTMKGSVYRNLLGSQKNLNTVMQQNALPTYFEFMQEYYLK